MADFIQVNFLRKILTKFGEIMTVHEVDALIEDMDTDKDGRIGHDEFMNTLK